MSTFLIGTALLLIQFGGSYGAKSTVPFLPSFFAPTPAKESAIPADEAKPILVWLTAYSSTPEETDDTPHVTASGTQVRDGIVAANFLPFGTKIRIPDVFGEKIFVVEDRMAKRKTNFVDVWMPTQERAKDFGITRASIVVLTEPRLAAGDSAF